MSEIKHTPGPWKAVPQGGHSTVLASAQPSRNDNRIPAFGYVEEGRHCIGYPFIEDEGRVRWDFVCFSHEDARLIAAAPELLVALEQAQAVIAVMFGVGPNAHIPETITTPIGIPIKVGEIMRDANSALAKAGPAS